MSDGSGATGVARLRRGDNGTTRSRGALVLTLIAAGALTAGCQATPESTEATSHGAAADTAPAAGPRPLTPDGWGPLRIGMTRAEVVAAAGEDANPEAVGGPEPEVCDQWRPAGAPAGMIVMLENGRLSRITLVRGSEVETAAGLGPGDAAVAVEAAHPGAVVTPHRYIEPPASYMTVWASGPDTPEPRGIVYEIGADGRVSHVHAGGPAIRYVEGCL